MNPGGEYTRIEKKEINVRLYESDFKSVESHKKDRQNKDVNLF